MFKFKKLIALVIVSVLTNIFVNNSQAESKKKVMFIVHTETINGKGVIDMYNILKSRGHELKIVVVPLITHGNKLLYDLDINFAQKFDPKDVVFPCGTQAPYTKCEGLGDYKADYVFIQNPYNSFKDTILDSYFSLESLKKIANKTAYIVYGPHLFHAGSCNNKHIKKLIDVVFVDSESTKKLFIENLEFSPTQVKVSGFQNYKRVRNMMTNHQRTSKYKETILWLPRWTLHTKDRNQHEGGSTFLNYHYFIYNYAKANPDVRFIIRPHVLLFKVGVENKFFSQQDAEDIKNKFKSLKNVKFSEHISEPLENDVIEADVVLSDGTSALGEVVVADKPIIYLSNGWDNEFNSNDLGREFKNYIYLAHDPDELLSHLDFIRLTGYAPFAAKSKFMGKLKSKEWELVPGREDFKKKLDPVKDPEFFIADYISAN